MKQSGWVSNVYGGGCIKSRKRRSGQKLVSQKGKRKKKAKSSKKPTLGEKTIIRKCDPNGSSESALARALQAMNEDSYILQVVKDKFTKNTHLVIRVERECPIALLRDGSVVDLSTNTRLSGIRSVTLRKDTLRSFRFSEIQLNKLAEMIYSTRCDQENSDSRKTPISIFDKLFSGKHTSNRNSIKRVA